jgi:hypothetical protein
MEVKVLQRVWQGSEVRLSGETVVMQVEFLQRTGKPSEIH